jgi:hypothetical protein
MALVPTKPLPDSIVCRPKTGFSIPVQNWIREETKEKQRGLKGWSLKIYSEFVGHG